jgi:hypothetical protein
LRRCRVMLLVATAVVKAPIPRQYARDSYRDFGLSKNAATDAGVVSRSLATRSLSSVAATNVFRELCLILASFPGFFLPSYLALATI